jgi:predicted exporter
MVIILDRIHIRAGQLEHGAYCFANLTPVAGLGLLMFSSLPILQAMGVTVRRE